MVTETLFTPFLFYFPVEANSGDEGSGQLLMAAPEAAEALSSGDPYPAAESETPGLLSPLATPLPVEEAYPLPESDPPAMDSLDSAYPAPVDGAEGGGTSFWEGIVAFFSNLFGWLSPAPAAHAAAEQASPAAPVQATILNGGEQQVVITYSYDPLNRLTNAIYSSGPAFTYTLDAVGNRLTQTALLDGMPETTAYLYDHANRLSNVDGVTYTWDNNGNLLWDGVYTYTYSSANRLTSVSDGQLPATNYSYNGLGDRARQTSGGVTTDYAIDLAGGLTQVLADGTNVYLYGNGRIAQYQGAQAEYFLGDALGSVRQLVDANGNVVLAKDYQPYGALMGSSGSGTTSYGFTGEMIDPNGLVYLRARYYAPGQGRFLSRDVWDGDYSQPLTLNKWLYVSANPINLADPSGMIAEGKEATDADSIVNRLSSKYDVKVVKDWGKQNIGYGQCGWNNGAWELVQLKWVEFAVDETAKALGMGNINPKKFKSAMGRSITISRWNTNSFRSFAPPGASKYIFGNVVLTNVGITDEAYVKHTVIHELGHVWDESVNWKLSTGMKKLLHAETCKTVAPGYGVPTSECHYDVTKGTEQWVGNIQNPYPNDDAHLLFSRDIQGPWEDWADSFTVYIYDKYYANLASQGFKYNSSLGKVRSQYIYDQIQKIP